MPCFEMTVTLPGTIELGVFADDEATAKAAAADFVETAFALATGPWNSDDPAAPARPFARIGLPMEKEDDAPRLKLAEDAVKVTRCVADMCVCCGAEIQAGETEMEEENEAALAQVGQRLEEEEEGLLELWWLDFKPRLGTFITEAPGLVHAIRQAWKLDCNPGGTVVGSVIPKDRIEPEYWNRLLSWEEAEELLKQVHALHLN
jgi:hypothetical protein